MSSGRWLHIAAVAGGVVAFLAGIGMLGAYVLEAVIKRLGEADQSLLFWYLPFALFGLMSVIAGIAATAWGVSRLRGSGGPLA